MFAVAGYHAVVYDAFIYIINKYFTFFFRCLEWSVICDCGNPRKLFEWFAGVYTLPTFTKNEI